MTVIMCFFVVLFANWSMDSIKHRYQQSIYFRWHWLRETRFFGYREFWKHDRAARNRRFKNDDPAMGRKKLFGVTLPQTIFDGWHFWKTIMVGGIVYITSVGLALTVGMHWAFWFVVLSVLWNGVWWVIYDLNYRTV